MARKIAETNTEDAPASETSAPAEKAPEPTGLYSLTFGDAPTTPAELYVGIPGGAKVYMNKYYKGDPGGDGWPYAELTLTAKDAAYLAGEYAMHGLLLQKIEASALEAHPLATPQAPE